jgi:hypothetical protein
VRAEASFEDPEQPRERRQLGDVERVGHAGLEPAQPARAPAREDDAALVGFAQDPVDAVELPHRLLVRGVAARDQNEVLLEQQCRQVDHVAHEQPHHRRQRAALEERTGEGVDGGFLVARGGGQECDLGARLAGAREQPGVERVPGVGAEAAAPDRDDRPRTAHRGLKLVKSGRRVILAWTGGALGECLVSM